MLTTVNAMPATTLFLQQVGPGGVLYSLDAETGALQGNLGSPDGGFIGSHEAHLTFGPSGNLFGISNERIWMYDFNTSSFSTVTDFSSFSSSTPGGFTVGPDGSLYLQSVGPGGTIYTFNGGTGSPTGSLGSFDGSFIGSFEAHLAFGPSGDLFGISNQTIWRYSFVSLSFSPVVDFSSFSSSTPGGFTVGPDGTLYLQSVGPGGSINTYSSTGNLSGNLGSFDGSFIGSGESHLAFGPSGDLYGISGQSIWRYSFTTDSFTEVADFTALSASTPGGFVIGIPEPSRTLLATLAFVMTMRRNRRDEPGRSCTT